MSRFVQRDNTGHITGSYARLQPGYAEEELADDDPELVAFMTPEPLLPPRDFGAEIDALKGALIKKDVVTEAEIAVSAKGATATSSTIA